MCAGIWLSPVIVGLFYVIEDVNGTPQSLQTLLLSLLIQVVIEFVTDISSAIFVYVMHTKIENEMNKINLRHSTTMEASRSVAPSLVKERERERERDEKFGDSHNDKTDAYTQKDKDVSHNVSTHREEAIVDPRFRASRWVNLKVCVCVLVLFVSLQFCI